MRLAFLGNLQKAFFPKKKISIPFPMTVKKLAAIVLFFMSKYIYDFHDLMARRYMSSVVEVRI